MGIPKPARVHGKRFEVFENMNLFFDRHIKTSLARFGCHFVRVVFLRLAEVVNYGGVDDVIKVSGTGNDPVDNKHRSSDGVAGRYPVVVMVKFHMRKLMGKDESQGFVVKDECAFGDKYPSIFVDTGIDGVSSHKVKTHIFRVIGNLHTVMKRFIYRYSGPGLDIGGNRIGSFRGLLASGAPA